MQSKACWSTLWLQALPEARCVAATRELTRPLCRGVAVVALIPRCRSRSPLSLSFPVVALVPRCRSHSQPTATSGAAARADPAGCPRLRRPLRRVLALALRRALGPGVNRRRFVVRPHGGWRCARHRSTVNALGGQSTAGVCELHRCVWAGGKGLARGLARDGGDGEAGEDEGRRRAVRRPRRQARLPRARFPPVLLL
jgi:hypothetical protein